MLLILIREWFWCVGIGMFSVRLLVFIVRLWYVFSFLLLERNGIVMNWGFKSVVIVRNVFVVIF